MRKALARGRQLTLNTNVQGGGSLMEEFQRTEGSIMNE
jgi:hypothetical protein